MVQIYGQSKAYGILAVIRMIMLGNASGIPLSSFLDRFRGRHDKTSGLVYEISMMLAALLFTPCAMAHALILTVLKVPVISFKEN